MRRAMPCSVCKKWYKREELYAVLSVSRMFMCEECFEDFFWDTEGVASEAGRHQSMADKEE